MAKAGTVFLALVAGVAIGAGVGVLFAPEKGKDTRKKIKDSVGDSVEKLKEKSSEIVGDFEENVERLLSKSSYKVEEIITILEKKLASLKSANAKFQK